MVIYFFIIKSSTIHKIIYIYLIFIFTTITIIIITISIYLQINLEKKCDLHKKKHDDACELKAVSDNRRKQVTTSLAMFSTEDMNDYECYTTAKPRLAMFVREVEDRIRLSRHQLDALLESMQQP